MVRVKNETDNALYSKLLLLLAYMQDPVVWDATLLHIAVLRCLRIESTMQLCVMQPSFRVVLWPLRVCGLSSAS